MKIYFKNLFRKNYNLDELLLERKKKLSDNIYRIFKGKVAFGKYKDTKISKKEHWSYDMASKILGLYESQVQEKITDIQSKKKLKILVNFGAGEGYHLTGLLKKKIFEKGYAFESNEYTKRILDHNIKINKLKKKTFTFAKSNFEILSKLIKPSLKKKVLFLIDIEGEEFDLIIKKNLKHFQNSHLIIENHNFLKNKKKVNNYLSFLKKNFKINIIENSSRNPFIFKKLKIMKDDDRWLLMSEGRPCQMSWILCTPKLNS
tara:strand:+ start:924 stop:1703 length:780 start_codon:yes stop_codon:yes gene_type:complete